MEDSIGGAGVNMKLVSRSENSKDLSPLSNLSLSSKAAFKGRNVSLLMDS